MTYLSVTLSNENIILLTHHLIIYGRSDKEKQSERQGKNNGFAWKIVYIFFNESINLPQNFSGDESGICETYFSNHSKISTRNHKHLCFSAPYWIFTPLFVCAYVFCMNEYTLHSRQNLNIYNFWSRRLFQNIYNE